MIALPTEVHLKILNYLPGKDVMRFQRLNSIFGNLVVNNQKRLPKARVSMTIGNGQWHSFYLSIKHFGHHLHFGRDGNLDVLSGTGTTVTAFKDSFTYYASQQPIEIPQKKLFFKWLLSKCDLESLTIQPYDEIDEICALLEEAMETVEFRCPTVIMDHGIHHKLDSGCVELASSFLQKFCAYQKNLKVKIKLYVKDPSSPLSEKGLEFLCLDCCNKYSEWFSDVFCEYSYGNMVLGFCKIGKKWHDLLVQNQNANITSTDLVKFTIRYNHEKASSAPKLRMGTRFSRRFFRLGYSLDNMTVDKFIGIREIREFDNLPEEVIFRRRSDGKILKVKLTKEEGRYVTFTIEFN